MDKLAVFKQVVAAIVGTSVSYTVGNIIKNNTEADNVVQKGGLLIGQVALGMYVSELTEKWLDEKIDYAVEYYEREVKPKLEE